MITNKRFYCSAIAVYTFAVLVLVQLVFINRALADSDLSGDWRYGTAGIMQLEQKDGQVRMTLTWNRYSIPGPHYEVVATKSGKNLDGRWQLYPGILPEDKIRSGRFHAELSEDGNKIIVSRTEDSRNSWNSTVFVRKHPLNAKTKESDRKSGDVWLGRWTGNSRYNTTKQVWKWWFEVSRYCDTYNIQTHTSGPEKVEIFAISATKLEFHFHDAPSTHVKLSLQEKGRFDGTIAQANNRTYPSGRIDGEKVKDAKPQKAELESVQIVASNTQDPIDDIAIGQSFRIKLNYKTPPCAGHIEKVMVRASSGAEQQVQVTGKGSRIISQPIRLVPRKKP